MILAQHTFLLFIKYTLFRHLNLVISVYYYNYSSNVFINVSYISFYKRKFIKNKNNNKQIK